MLKIGPGEATPLADVIGSRTNGNPYDTIELINALRRDGALTATVDGWVWDAATVRRYLGRGDVVDLLVARINALPHKPRPSCKPWLVWGAQSPSTFFVTPSVSPQRPSRDCLLPAVENGLLVTDDNGQTILFRTIVFSRPHLVCSPPLNAPNFEIKLARRLATHPGQETRAAEQYLPVVDAIVDSAERRDWWTCSVSPHATPGSSPTTTEPNASPRRPFAVVVSADPIQVDRSTLTELAIEWHAALYGLGRASEANDAFRQLTDLTEDPVVRATAARIQVSNLINQNRHNDAVTLGLDILRQLG